MVYGTSDVRFQLSGIRRFSTRLALAGILLIACQALPAQTLTPRQRILLQRKGELLQDIKTSQEKEADAQSTLDQAQQALASGTASDAGTAQQVIELGERAIADAKDRIADDQQRLTAINAALAWPESDSPRAVATLVVGQVFRDTLYGQVPFDGTAPIQVGDHIVVGDNSYLELQLEDGSQIELGAGTDFSYQRDVQGIEWQLFRGEMHKITIIMSVRGANDQPRYRGCTAVAAVRGTDFTMDTDGTQDTFTVFEGEIDVDPGGGRDKLTLQGGQKLVVPKTGVVGPPVAFDPQSVPRWWKP
jgi:FecR-like protein